MTRDDLEKLLFEGESTYPDWKRNFAGELCQRSSGSSWLESTIEERIVDRLTIRHQNDPQVTTLHGQGWRRSRFRGRRRLEGLRDDNRSPCVPTVSVLEEVTPKRLMPLTGSFQQRLELRH